MTLTIEQVKSEPAGNRMDNWIAECVMKWKLNLGSNIYEGINGDWHLPEDHEFSQDIASAWEVVEKVHYCKVMKFTHEPIPELDSEGKVFYQCELHFDDYFTRYAEAETAPLAICRAALLCVLEKGSLQ